MAASTGATARALALGICLSLLVGCSGRLVRKEVAARLNEGFAEQVFSARRDIPADYATGAETLYGKQTQLRVYIETHAEWIKLRAYGAATAREQARGKAIVYVFLEDLPDPESVAAKGDGRILEYLALKALMAGIAEYLVPVNQKTSKKGR